MKKGWELLKKDYQDDFHHADKQVCMYTRLSSEGLCKDHQELRIISTRDVNHSSNNLGWGIVGREALAWYAPVEMLLGVYPRVWRAKSAQNIEVDPRYPPMFMYINRQKYILNNDVATNALTLLNSHGAQTTPAVSSMSVHAGVPLQTMPAVVNLPTIAS